MNPLACARLVRSTSGNLLPAISTHAHGLTRAHESVGALARACRHDGTLLPLAPRCRPDDEFNGTKGYVGFTVAAGIARLWHLHTASGWTNSPWALLPFDPAASFHRYTLSILDTEASLHVDGTRVARLRGLAPFERPGAIRLMTHCGTTYCSGSGTGPAAGVADCRGCGAGATRYRTFRVTPTGEEPGDDVPLCVAVDGCENETEIAETEPEPETDAPAPAPAHHGGCTDPTASNYNGAVH